MTQTKTYSKNIANELDQREKQLGIEDKIDRLLHSNINKGKGIKDEYECNF